MAELVQLCPECGIEATVAIAQDKLKYCMPVVICRACKLVIGRGQAHADRYPNAPTILSLGLKFYGLEEEDLIDREPSMVSDTEGAGGYKIINAGSGVRMYTRRGERIFRLTMMDKKVAA